MAVNYRYYLGPWQFADNFWSPPPGTVGLVDLVPPESFDWAAQFTAHADRPVGFFAVDGDPLDNSYYLLGQGDCREIAATTSQNDAFQSLVGVKKSGSLVGLKLVDILYAILFGDNADPDGVIGPLVGQPEWPTGLMPLHLGGHSVVKSSTFDGNLNRVGYGQRLRTLLRRDLERLETSHPGHWQKAWGAMCVKYRLDRNNATQADTFLSPAMKVRHGNGKTKPQKPETTITDDFGDGLRTDWGGTGGEYGSWAESGGKLSHGGWPGSYVYTRKNSDLSSADHSASVEAVGSATNTETIGGACRWDASAVTMYGGFYGGRSGLLSKELSKWVASSHTSLWSVMSGALPTPPFTVETVVNGSSLSLKVDGVTQHTLTDTSIPSGLRGGIVAIANSADLKAERIVIADSVAAPVAAFSGTPLTGTAPLSDNFTESSTNSPTSWLWEKNDGSGWVNFEGTPTAQNPTEIFTAGTWSIRLTATNAGGSDAEEKTDYITVTAADGDGRLQGCLMPPNKAYKFQFPATG